MKKTEFLFNKEVAKNIDNLGKDERLKKISSDWILGAGQHNYAYNFRWLDRPIIQLPQDIVAIQEIIWKVKPDLIIETGIAHGGSLILSASMLFLLNNCITLKSGTKFDPNYVHRTVLGLDIDIRPHNRSAIENHPLSFMIEMIEGNSIDPEIIAKVYDYAKNYQKILVILDSNHTHNHVLSELEAYTPLVSIGSYCVVFDTIIEELSDDIFTNRPWGKGNNPKTSVLEFLKKHDEFEVDKDIEWKLLLTAAPDGWLKRIR